jgi:cytochrome c peroxidase
MKRSIIIFSILIFGITVGTNMIFVDTPPPKIYVCDQLKIYVGNELGECINQLNGMLGKTSIKALQKSYRKARKHYKHIEFIVEYESPGDAKIFINGPLVLKFDPEIGPTIFTPHGFQQIEEMLFSGDPLPKDKFEEATTRLIKSLTYLKDNYRNLALENGRILETCQLQLFRIAAMNFNGYDATISLDGIKESVYCLEGLEMALVYYKPLINQNKAAEPLYKALKKQLKVARKALKKNTDYNTFNRLDYIVKYIIPINASLVDFHNGMNLPWSDWRQALNLNNKVMFGEAMFNPRQFGNRNYNVNNEAQAALGKLLFFDPILSKHNDMSCSSCHDPLKGFTDGRELSFSRGNVPGTTRNVPSLIDAMFQKSFFYDGRSSQLELQIFEVIHNKNEMESAIEDAVVKLKKSKEYRELFKNAFGASLDSNITPYSIQKAIAEYERTLVSLNSPFDKYLHGDSKQLSPSAVRGYNLFAGKAMCGSCHFFPIFNGTVPTLFKDSEFEVLGVPATKENKELDDDKGRFNFTGKPYQMFAFKTPTVRNVDLTAPYMHNGIYHTLEEVIEFYHKGGGKGFGFNLENQTLPFDSLPLNNTEKIDIINFLHSLTDTTGITSRPLKLPLIEGDSILNKRKSDSY